MGTLRDYLLVALLALLLAGCTGDVPDSMLLPQESGAPIADSAADGEPIMEDEAVVTENMEASAEETQAESSAASDARAPVDPALPGNELFTFTAGEPGWYNVDDNVMGGVSDSRVAIAEPDILVFWGTMSLENNGGFASVRSDWRQMDLSDADGILLRVLGDGNTYRLRLRTDTTDRNISYNARFDTTPDQWQTVYIPFDDMVPTSFGYVMDVGPVDRGRIGSFGFMLSDNQPGEFALAVDWVRAVSAEELAAMGT